MQRVETRRVRSDGLPEHRLYVDTGCEVAPKCLECPLVLCKYEDRGAVWRARAADRHRQAQVLRAQFSPPEVARRMGISLRQVYRLQKPQEP